MIPYETLDTSLHAFETKEIYTERFFCPGVNDVSTHPKKCCTEGLTRSPIVFLNGKNASPNHLLSREAGDLSRMDVTHPGNEAQDLLSECQSKLFF